MLTKTVDCASHLFGATLPDERGYQVVVAKRTYEVDPSFALMPRREQEFLSFADEPYEEINESSLYYPSDIVPYKPAADILVAANAVSSGSRPSESWECGLSVDGQDHLEKRLRVHGPRQWEPEWMLGTPKAATAGGRTFIGWQLSKPKPVKNVPILYEYAWGGQNDMSVISESDVVTVCEANPLGTGWIDRKMTDHTTSMPAPQIEYADQPIKDPYSKYAPAGLGPIMPAWLPRRPLGGTFDQAWIDSRRPWWPEDYDFRFHNAAPADMQWNGFLAGDETVTFRNLTTVSGELTLSLPATGLVVRYEGTEYRMALDTAFFDVRAADQEDWIITLTWRLVLQPQINGLLELDEVYISHPRYQRAQPPHVPAAVAAREVDEPEKVNG